MSEPTKLIIAMHATLGDGTINLYSGPAGPETQKAIEAINDYWEDMAEPNPNKKTIRNAEGEIQECSSDADLAETLLWWANSCEPRSEWEVDTGVSTGIDLD